MGNGRAKRAPWVLFGLGVGGLALAGYAFMLDQRVAESLPVDGARGLAAAGPDDRGRQAPDAGALLAPAGHVIRALDRTGSPTLSLGLVDVDGDGFLCTIGRARGDTAPLDTARCRRATAQELEAPVRSPAGTPQVLGSRTYHVNPAGELLAAVGDDMIRVAPMPPAPEAIRVCETADVDVVAVDGDLVHGVRQTSIAFLGPTTLLAVVMGETHGFTYHFACRPDDVRLTWLAADVEGDAPILVVRQAACDRESCHIVESRLPRTGTDPAVAALAGQVLLVYAGDDGTRMRLAPVTEIPDAADLEVPSDGEAPVLSRSLFARGGAAIVAIRTTVGVSALRVDATGSVTRLLVETTQASGP